MFDANTHQFCPAITALLSSLLLPLFLVALLSAITGGTLIAGSVLSEAFELLMTFLVEILQRLLKLAFVFSWFFLRLVSRAVLVFYAWGEEKFRSK